MTQTNNMILDVKDLRATVNNIPILKGVNLQVQKGEIHAIMGPNGSGKSTFSKVIAGHPSYTQTGGEIFLNNEEISDLEPEVRALQGIFLAFQYPIEIPGVSNTDFLRLAYNMHQKSKGREELDPLTFLNFLIPKLKIVGIDQSFLTRNVNEGFSGGEKKKNEILQMALLESSLSILDETDSGLDVDALRTIAAGINKLKSPENAIILITHYQRLLDYITPDFVHIMENGKIISSGKAELAQKVEVLGYDWLKS
uniref:iron-sulfur cluster formation ABC transporter ATP-binding subunit n=1 Tax=Rhodella violacea TaxID=2801 RepID=UPI001FCDCBB7|nr:iron-sulfur cluster formation ABC transporter ATP-binding subunit [Rhodella violacea]UNJ18141.1 iron-sulfur cluster formation ABC transporter ATP-binding subunit [Rhodella violacea]